MGTVRTQTSATSLDADGITEVTATRTDGMGHRGIIYDAETLAAAVPVHFHPLTPGRYLMAFAERWHGAIPSESDPGAFTDYARDLTPGWIIVGASGTRTPPGRGMAIPGATGQLTAACSRGNTYLYVLTSSLDGLQARVQLFRWSPDRDIVVAVSEEILPRVGNVVFDLGLFLTGTQLTFVGSDRLTGQLFFARKPWGRIGANRTAMRGQDRSEIDDPSWQYYTGTGWSRDPGELAPLPMTSHGPVSMAAYRDTIYLAVVGEQEDERLGQVWASTKGRPYRSVGEPVSLGTTGEGYVGAGLQLQPQLRAQASELSIPYVTTVHEIDGDAHRLNTSWGLWQVLT
ncbi:hypothetical protein SEA_PHRAPPUCCINO_133 [Mycobacterium phage Phrappuccino]|uniref:DUF4185 domain-containing protein n=1 Tax=Mycobacterium phage Phrappuccino TaxID=2591223 RepID=A0A514DDY3_9CAUD|nr:hypothetical protein KHQ87_gp133 [Mycobacterium phage Phrappuccino]QDH91808.1 hypothetical protein SEA_PHRAPPUCCINO_133 [Mycobacterium phage Phrappuccino]QIQ63250.1 hypothetical protein SEA_SETTECANDELA_133 [Mycobacterium phage Settecandela]